MKRLVYVIVVFGLLGVFRGFAQDAISSADEIVKLKKAIAELRAENTRLREENQMLRKLVAEPTSAPVSAATVEPNNQNPPARLPAEKTVSVPASDQAETGFWLTTSSNKRHNKGCRYYKQSKGRPCTKDEGIACKICGG